MGTDKTLEEQVLEKLDSLWREFYFYGWCDSEEDREEFDVMKTKLQELIRDVINAVTIRLLL